MNTKDLYSHKPPQITSVSDLIAFFSGIPEDKWCVGRLENDVGRCAVGHLFKAYGYSGEAFLPLPECGTGFSRVNDGFTKFAALGNTPKARVLAYLRSLEPTSRPSPSVLNQVATLASVTIPCP